MEWQQYTELAMRTASPRDPENHGWMGLATETGELVDFMKKVHIYGKPADYANFREELGDVFWYVAFEYVRLKMTTPSNDMGAALRDSAKLKDPATLLKGLYVTAGKYADQLDSERPVTLGYIFVILKTMALKAAAAAPEGVDLSFDRILEINIEKLAKRYGDKYSDYAVLNRNLDAERKVLEQ